jgi:hypothetical protein
MSVENNSLRSIDGLNTLSCDVINVVESIEIDGDNGNVNQLLTSDGTRTLWADLSSLLQQLSVSSPLSFVSGTFYDGSVARAIEIADGAIANVKLQNSTISGVSLGSNLENLYFGNGLLTIDAGGGVPTGYNGSGFVGFSVKPKVSGGITVDADGVSLTNDTISGVSLGNNLYNLNVSNPLSFSGGGPNNYDGSQTKTIQIANGAIDNQKLADSTISGISLGDDLDDLTAGTGLELNTGTTYNGSAGRTLNFKAKSGGGISVDGTGAYLTEDEISGISLGNDLNDLTAGTGLQLNSGTTYNGGTAKTLSISPSYISDRISLEDTGVGIDRYLYTITATEWRPNDDSATYNIHIEDDVAVVYGRAKISLAALEAIAIIHIPYNWTPAKIFIDCRDAAGADLSRTYYLYKIRNWGGTGNTYLGSYTTNSETSFATTYGAGESGYSLMIKMILTATTDHLGGGYITLTPP